ncbi:hypothetical protein [Streptomyces sp. NPDC005262]|uniref:hypothetical protein n=1 Tax=Streptomyces sp. NPDC005262 TaxID=3364710 RepID=UPI00369FD6BB
MPIPLGLPFRTPLRTPRTVPGSGHHVVGIRLNDVQAAAPFDGHGRTAAQPRREGGPGASGWSAPSVPVSP